VADSNNVLSNHRFDNTQQRKQKRGETSSDDDDNNNDNTYKKEDNNADTPTLSFAQLEGKCYCCGKPGHKSPDCRKKAVIPRDEWAINKAQAHTNVSLSTPITTSEITTDSQSHALSVTEQSETQPVEETVGWAGMHCSFLQGTELRDLILLDSDSTDSIFATTNM